MLQGQVMSKEGKFMKRCYKFAFHFLIVLIVLLTLDVLLKQELEIRTALSIATGISLGVIIVDWYTSKKAKK
jgi:hypothetical protein